MVSLKAFADCNVNVAQLTEVVLANQESCYFENLVEPFPKHAWFLRVYITSLLKTLWEKDKLLLPSNLLVTFSYFVFKPFG